MLLIVCAAAVAAVALATWAAESDGRQPLTQFWIQHTTDLRDEKKRAASLELLKKAKSAGVTHMTLNEPSMYRWDLVDDAYTAKAKEFTKAAEEAGVQIVPSVFPIGYGLRFLAHDVNLAAGLPVAEAPFVVKGGEAKPDPSAVPTIVDGGFEKVRGGTLARWRMDHAGEFSFVDKDEKHSGKSSVRIGSGKPLPEEAKGTVRLTQTVAVEPFKYYRLSLWMKTQDVKAEREDYIQIFSLGGKRRNTYYNMDVKPTQDWTRHECVFNTLEACEIDLSVGVTEYKGGTAWFDDLEVEPAGLLNVVRRDATPLVVTSADGKTVYKEGKDFERVSDPGFTSTSLGDVRHEAPPIRLTKKSRIRGRRLLVSYYHAMRIYNDQIGLSFEEPRLYEMMDRQMELVARLWPTKSLFMAADEIRVAGWEVQEEGTHLSPSQLLARYMKRSLDIIRKYSPGAELYIWSDMFTPFHNGRPFEESGFYYLCSGTYYGCWKELPAEVNIANWYAPSRLSPVWFEQRGHKQIMCGYYDNPNLKANIASWMERTRGVDNVIGIMYTNWSTGFDLMEEYFRLARTYPDWLEQAGGDAGIKER
jgi:hypothetical protein